MTSTQTSPRSRARSTVPTGMVLRAVGLFVALVVLLVVVPWMMRGPSFVGHVTVDNSTRFPIEVSVSAPGSSEVLGLGDVAPGSSATFESVVDPGSSWKVRLVANGGATVETTVNRSDVAGNRWTFTITPEMRDQLAQRGALAFAGG